MDLFVSKYLFSTMFKDELVQVVKSNFRMTLTGSYTICNNFQNKLKQIRIYYYLPSLLIYYY